MVFFKRFKKKTTKKSTKKAYRRYRYRRSSKIAYPIRRYVNREIKKNVENKKIQYLASFNIRDYIADTALNAFWLSPNSATLSIVQGTGQSQRVGNRIKIVKATLTYFIMCNPYEATSNPTPEPTLVKLWIGYYKNDPVNVPADFTNFFQSGSSSAAPNGYIEDMMRIPNSDKFVVFKTKFHRVGFSAYTGTGPNAAAQYFDNNEFKYTTMKRVDVTKYMLSNVVYNDTINNPTSRGLYCWCECVPANNTTLGGTLPVLFKYFIDITYEDA